MKTLLGPKGLAEPGYPRQLQPAQLHVSASGRCRPQRQAFRTVALAGEQVPASAALAAKHKTSFKNANFPTDSEGRTYHLGTKRGEVANRILSVGSTQRAQLLSTLLQPLAPGEQLFQRLSSRGFLTITGCFEGVPVSIVSTHMGMPNMDFVVRENRAVVTGKMAIVRLGTCGAVQPPAKLGDLLIASQGSIAIHRNPDYWTAGPGSNGHQRQPYHVTLPVPANAELASLLVEEASKMVGPSSVVEGLNASADSFYSSQGRIGTDFDDDNEALLSGLCAQYPNFISLEMETFQLLDLARCSEGSIKAVSLCIALAERYSNAFLEYSKLEELELKGGRAALRALTRMQLQQQQQGPGAAAGQDTAAAISNGASQSLRAVAQQEQQQ